jgi:hypothetical protein
MNGEERSRLATRALDGYVHGPDAPRTATTLAIHEAVSAEALIIVEGISDQIAIETLAVRRGRNLRAVGVAVLPVGGSGSAARYLREYGPAGKDLSLSGLCDLDAAETFRMAMKAAGIGAPETVPHMEALGFHVCVRDLEDELIRALGTDAVEAVISSQGDLGSFRTLQHQPEWRDRPTSHQLHRFFRSQARRSLRYARLLVEAAPIDRVPRPLAAVLDRV